MQELTDSLLERRSIDTGDEIGQVSFVLLGVLPERIRRRHWVEVVPGYAVGSLGAFWTIRRTAIRFGFGR